MKRQRNSQQVKERDKCPSNETKEEEIGSLPEKEFRIRIVKMIQNLENKMELQINRLETRIEKMQEMFNKDLEEIKKSQPIMNNAITEIKNTLEGTKAFDCVDHNKLWKILKEMEIPDHITCLLRNLYAGQEGTVRTGHGTADWFQTGKGVRQGYILSPCLFNFYAEYIMRNPGLEETYT